MDASGSLYIPLQIGSIEAMGLLDSGATISVIHPSVLSKVMKSSDVVLKRKRGKLQVADGNFVHTFGSAMLRLSTVDGLSSTVHEMVVAEVDTPVVIGVDFLKQHGCVLDLANDTLRIGERVHHCRRVQDMPRVYKIMMADTVVVPPMCEMLVPGKVNGEAHFTHGIVEERDYPLCHGNVAMSKMIVDPSRSTFPLRVANLSSEPQTLHKGMSVADCEEIHSIGSPLFDDKTPVDECKKGPATSPCDGLDGVQLPDHMVGMSEEFRDRLTDQENLVARTLLSDFKSSFNARKRDLQRTDKLHHSMTMKSDHPVKLPPYRVPLSKLPGLREELDDMLDAGIIEPSCSAWASPLVLATKKDGAVRVCVDFRRVNNLTVKDSYPLPRIDDSISALRGSEWFSTLDLSSGFWQVPMDPKDVDKTAFTTPYGLFQFRTMPFGLANAPSTFQRLMELVLAGLHWEACLIYLDDIIIFSSTFDEHVNRLRQVLTRLRDANLQLNPSKCHFFQHEVECLGFIVSNEGIRTDPRKTEAVNDWPRPRTVKEVRSFLGLCSYYRRFVKNFADIAAPMYQLTQRDAVFDWNLACEDAFVSLKQALVHPPILCYPSEDATFVLDTDASNVGLGAVLSQVQDGKERVVAYFSKSLSPAERRYCVTRRELLAIISSVKHFHHYLYGRHFLIRTDHGSLQWLLRFKRPEGQLARWLETLYMYDFTIEHRSGRLHGNADGLSRRPCQECNYCAKREALEEIEDEGCPGHRLYSMQQAELADDS